jgi:hypothetical protein
MLSKGNISMCIYCGTTKYRKIYENHYGPIPKDETGRSYEIHHIDGNRSNNDPINLKCVSIQEHYDIHYSQGDWAACLKIGSKMKIPSEELSKMASLSSRKRISDGTHPFKRKGFAKEQNIKRVLNGSHPFMGEEGGIRSRQVQLARIENGTHPFLGGEIQKKVNKKRVEEGTHNFLGPSLNRERVKKGTHPFLKRQDGSSIGKEVAQRRTAEGLNPFTGSTVTKNQLLNGSHPSQIKKECEYCKKILDSANYGRWHGSNCHMHPRK